ncbi:hypothetical protein CEXT_97261 [Caerostris extrusa]|uniref:Uncharacterized protein n=1 Tax=Caerostris extrusa TaxID=172846 RepID=A0AAV4NIW6_CAEEX|nr:hypothetical protein CEXT_97261 [Caerostris extrusa]
MMKNVIVLCGRGMAQWMASSPSKMVSLHEMHSNVRFVESHRLRYFTADHLQKPTRSFSKCLLYTFRKVMSRFLPTSLGFIF